MAHSTKHDFTLNHDTRNYQKQTSERRSRLARRRLRNRRNVQKTRTVRRLRPNFKYNLELLNMCLARLGHHDVKLTTRHRRHTGQSTSNVGTRETDYAGRRTRSKRRRRHHRKTSDKTATPYVTSTTTTHLDVNFTTTIRQPHGYFTSTESELYVICTGVNKGLHRRNFLLETNNCGKLNLRIHAYSSAGKKHCYTTRHQQASNTPSTRHHTHPQGLQLPNGYYTGPRIRRPMLQTQVRPDWDPNYMTSTSHNNRPTTNNNYWKNFPLNCNLRNIHDSNNFGLHIATHLELRTTPPAPTTTQPTTLDNLHTMMDTTPRPQFTPLSTRISTTDCR